MNQIIFITGPACSAKSEVAEAICERSDRMLHIEVEKLRRFVKAGYRYPWALDAAAQEQRLLAVRSASAIAREALASRYAVVIDDVILRADADRYRVALRDVDCSVFFALILPELDIVSSGDLDTSSGTDVGEHERSLHKSFIQESVAGRIPGAVIESAHDDNAQLTADRVLRTVASREALFFES